MTEAPQNSVRACAPEIHGKVAQAAGGRRSPQSRSARFVPPNTDLQAVLPEIWRCLSTRSWPHHGPPKRKASHPAAGKRSL